MASYFLSDGSKKYGPFSKEKVFQLLFANQITLFDLVFDSKRKKWVRIIDHPDFSKGDNRSDETNSVLMGLFPKDAPGEKTEEISISKSEESTQRPAVFQIKDKNNTGKSIAGDAILWQIKSGGVVMGPYRYLKMIQMIQTGELKDNDLIKKVSDREWLPASKRNEFSRETLSTLPQFQVGKPLAKSLFKRTQPRKNVPAEFSVLTLSGATYHVQPIDISTGGLSFATRGPILMPGEKAKIYIGVKIAPLGMQFEVDCLILKGQKYSSQKTEGVVISYRYSAKFLKTSDALARWISSLPNI